MLYENIGNKIKSIMALEGIQNKQLAQSLNETEQNISQKLKRKTIRLMDVEKILDALGYKLVIQKKE